MSDDAATEAAAVEAAAADEAALDLTPRPPLAKARSGSRGKRWVSIGLLIAVVAAGGVIVGKFLTDAIDYFCTLDELDVRDGCSTGGRLRVLGTVEEGSVESKDGTTTFTIADKGRTLDVRYRGVPAGMFAECQPVVVHGVLNADGVFEGDNIDVRHDNEYTEAHPDRVTEDGRSPMCTQ